MFLRREKVKHIFRPSILQLGNALVHITQPLNLVTVEVDREGRNLRVMVGNVTLLRIDQMQGLRFLDYREPDERPPRLRPVKCQSEHGEVLDLNPHHGGNPQ